MNFEYTCVFYVSEEDLNKMVEIAREPGFTVHSAVVCVATGWDDEDYCKFFNVEDAIEAEVKKRMEEKGY